MTPRPTHVTHIARLVAADRASGRRAEVIRIVARFYFVCCRPSPGINPT